MNVSLSVDARQAIDLKLGVAFTRYLTMNFKKEFANFKDKTISYGPCQSPALGLVSSREDAIENFTPRKYFDFEFSAAKKGTKDVFNLSYGQTVPTFFVKEEAAAFREKIPNQGKLKSIDVTTVKKPSKEGLNSVGLMYHMSKALGMRSFDTMALAERLYLSGYITYPRTESTKYPKDFPYKETLKGVAGYEPKFTRFIEELIQKPDLGSSKGTDKGDHPPIAPTTKCPEGLSEGERKVYEFVLRSFLASIGEDTVIEKSVYKFQFGDMKFKVESSRIVKGHLAAILGKTVENETKIASFGLKEGDDFELVSHKLREKFTEPPKPMQEHELIKQMEAHSIGTDASMSKHIQTLTERGYITFDDKMIRVNELGKMLIRTLKTIDPELVDANLRKDMELSLKTIVDDGRSYPRVLNQNLEFYKAKYRNFTLRIHEVNAAFKESFKTKREMVDSEGKPFILCLKCNKYMIFSAAAMTVVCKPCGFSYDFPDSKDAKQLEGGKCPRDKHALIQYAVEVGDKKVWVNSCVVCMKADPDVVCAEDKAYSFCDACEARTMLGFSKDKTILYEVCSAKKCRALWKVLENVSLVSANPKSVCEACQSFKVKLEFSKKAKAFASESFEDVCLNCDERFNKEYEEVEVKYVSSRRFFRGKRPKRGRR